MMLPFVKTLAANEVCEVSLTGNYLELRSAAAEVARVELLDKSGGVVSLLEEIEATDFVRTSRQFETIRITNGATAQALRFYYGDGDSGSNRFTGVVSGEVSMSAATVAALIAGKYNVRPEAHSGYSNLGGVLGGNTTELVVEPAANSNGVIVLDAYASTVVGGSIAVNGGLLAKASAPVSISDGVLLAMCVPKFYNGTGNATYSEVSMMTPLMVSSGLGIYWRFNQDVNQQRAVRYIIL